MQACLDRGCGRGSCLCCDVLRFQHAKVQHQDTPAQAGIAGEQRRLHGFAGGGDLAHGKALFGQQYAQLEIGRIGAQQRVDVVRSQLVISVLGAELLGQCLARKQQIKRADDHDNDGEQRPRRKNPDSRRLSACS